VPGRAAEVCDNGAGLAQHPHKAGRGTAGNEHGLSGEALMWLFNKGIIMMGTDSFTMDISINVMTQKLKAGDESAYFAVHKGCVIKESSHVEKLYNLKKLPRPFGFKVAVFPIKLENCTGAWTRAVAIL
jgi:kynurenine formamidase